MIHSRRNPSSELVFHWGSFSQIAILVCFIGILAYFIARLGGTMMMRPQMVWPLWPGCAFLVAVLLTTPRRLWTALIAAGFAGFIVYDLETGLTIRTIALLILSDTIEVLIASLGMAYAFDGIPRLDSLDSLARFLLFVVILAPIAAAFVGAVALGGSYWVSWRIAVLTEALALLTLTPAILSWVHEVLGRAKRSGASYLEGATLTAGLVFLGYITFVAPGDTSRPVLLYSLVPFLLWAALRYGSMGISNVMMAIAFLSIWGAVHGRGPFTGGSPLDNVLSLQLFLLFAAASFMVLAAVVEEQKHSGLVLRRKGEELVEAQRLANVGSWQWDVATGAFSWSEELYRIHGLDPGSLPPVYKEFPKLFTRQSWDRLNALMSEALHTGSVRELDLEVVRPDGSKRWVTTRGEVVRDPAGRVTHMLGTVQDITSRKQMSDKLRESQDQLAGIIASAMDAIITVDEEQRILLFNAAAEKMFGCSAHDAVGTPINRFVPERFREEHRTHIRRFRETGITNRPMGEIGALWGLRASGQEFPIEASISRIQAGAKQLFTVVIRDITDRRRAEEAIRESEERFRLVANTAPVLIWMSGPDKLRTYVNHPWLEFTGRPLDAELGNGWSEAVHGDDLKRCQEAFVQAFDKRKPVETQYRLRRHDGEYRWMLDMGVPRFNADGSFAGYIGSCIDINDRKVAEEALSSVNRKLIEAHEEERTRIARELHDDINQRIALLAIEVEQFEQSPPNSASKLHRRIRQTQRHISDLGSDIQALSHRLHSSKLEYLGLAAAARGFCQEFSEQQKVDIEITVADIPHNLSEEISFCIFRVMQEALQNAVKHSGVNWFKVDLRATSDQIHLSVCDSGVGLDPASALSGRGLGIVSMRERLRLVGGELVISSQPKVGTTIKARVPISEKSSAVRLAV